MWNLTSGFILGRTGWERIWSKSWLRQSKKELGGRRARMVAIYSEANHSATLHAGEQACFTSIPPWCSLCVSFWLWSLQSILQVLGRRVHGQVCATLHMLHATVHSTQHCWHRSKLSSPFFWIAISHSCSLVCGSLLVASGKWGWNGSKDVILIATGAMDSLTTALKIWGWNPDMSPCWRGKPLHVWICLWSFTFCACMSCLDSLASDLVEHRSPLSRGWLCGHLQLIWTPKFLYKTNVLLPYLFFSIFLL